MTKPDNSLRCGSVQKGFALVTAMILLLVLTLVGLIAIRSTGLEVRMSANTAMRTEALDSSETSRSILAPVIDVHVFNRGWSDAIGGEVPDDIFAYTLPSGLDIEDDPDTSKPGAWYLGNYEQKTTGYEFNPFDLQNDAQYKRDIVIDSAEPLSLGARLAIYKLRTTLNPGAGTAMVAGYEGTGKAAAASGGNIFFFVRSDGNDPANESDAVTGAIFRSVIRN